MATYLELMSLYGDGQLRRKVEVAVTVAAQTILAGLDTTDPPWGQTSHVLRAKWANAALTNTEGEALRLLRYALAANRSLTAAQITGASDSALQDKVNEAIDEIAIAAYS